MNDTQQVKLLQGTFAQETELWSGMGCNERVSNMWTVYELDSGQSRVESGPHSWSIQLDQDLLDTIIAIYPEWFKEYNQKRGAMSEGSGGASKAPQSLSSSSSSGSLAAEVDDSPLQKTMDKNKESLKVKLMMRRPINQLVAQGIMPSLKTPPAFHEQRQKLERAKMGDLLKAKIQQRPDREELVRQHILEADVTHVDPSLAERQRMLKKARLADSLNDQLSHRPGPLELIKKNILHTEEPIERAVKEGVIPFKATSEGQLRKPQHPDHYITFEDDSQSSEGGGSPSNTPASFPGNSHPTTLENIASNVAAQSKSKESRPRDVLETAAASAGIVNVAVTIPTNAVVVTSPILQQIPNDKNQTLQTFAELCSSVVSPLSLGSSTSSLSPLSSIASPPTPLTPRPAPMSSPAPGKADKNRKKSKTKTQPKTRTIKFHEYKGPPNAQKNTQVSASSTETSYELLLQQQQLFLQWQLEWQHKYPQILLPAAQKPTPENITNLQNTISTINSAGGNAGTTFLVTQSPRASTPVVRPATPYSKPPSSPPQTSNDSQASNQNTQTAPNSNAATNAATLKVLTKLEDMKVSDLKMELKKRNLPVSGPKPQLIERLKPFTQSGNGEQQQAGSETSVGRTLSTSTTDNPGSVVSEMDIAGSPSNQNEDEEIHFSPSNKTLSPSPSSPTPSAMDTSEPTPPTSPNNGDIIIQQQQRKIEELQRELERSQQQLQQIRQGKDGTTGTKNSPNQTTLSSTIPVKALLQNGIIHIDPKSQQKLILQQHLQNKMQQQQLQIQLQQLQRQQNGQQFNETVNAKASLAAFITQQQAQQQLNNLLQTGTNNNSNSNNSNNNDNNNSNNNSGNNTSNNVNSNSGNNNNSNSNNNSTDNNINNNSNNNNINNNNNNSVKDNSNNNNNNNNNIKNKLSGRRSIVLGQQQAAIVLNHLNLVKQKNGILGHQRTSSLPAFLGALVQNTIAVEDKQEQTGKVSVQKNNNQNGQSTNAAARRAGSEEQTFIVTTKPPPEYEEATKALKQEGNSEGKTGKSVKSQIVDDVLEILIKNGELPPSAANDPATPTTPGRSGSYDPDKGLIYPPAPPPPPPPPLPQPGFSVTLPTSITLSPQSQPPPQFNLPNTTFSSSSPFTLTTQSVNPPTYTLTQAYVAPAAEREAIPGNQGITNSITFSVSNPSFINTENNNSKNTFSSGLNYLENTEFMSTETSDFDINNSNDQNFHSNSLDYILSSNDNLLSSELSSSDNILPSEYGNGDINLKELGLDLETLDSMDFSQLDCKMDSNDTEMDSTPAESGSPTESTTTTTTTTASGTTNKTDQLINNNPDLVKPELIEPMEMDDNWLDSLMPLSENQSGSHFGNSLTSSSNGYEFLHCNDSSYDSLLGSAQDPFELFDIHDNDFKLPSSSLSWDKVDFAT